MTMNLDVAATLDTLNTRIRPGKFIITDEFSIILHE